MEAINLVLIYDASFTKRDAHVLTWDAQQVIVQADDDVLRHDEMLLLGHMTVDSSALLGVRGREG